MRSLLLLVLVVIALGCQHQPVSRTLQADPQFGSLRNPGQSSSIVLIPQWHLSASTLTKNSSTPIPQKENQMAIYSQLINWMKSNEIKTLIVEGCEGETKKGFSPSFNGWTLQELIDKNAKGESIDEVMTQVGIKIKAKLGDKADVVCGDDVKLIQEHQLALSNLRGLFGFKSRIEQYKDDRKNRESYVSSLRALLKMPNAPEHEVLTALNKELRKNLDSYKMLIEKRNESFVKKSRAVSSPSAIVIGALHVDHLLRQFGDTAVTVFDAKGMQGGESQIIDQIEKML